jgi:hypothetical protein
MSRIMVLLIIVLMSTIVIRLIYFNIHQRLLKERKIPGFFCELTACLDPCVSIMNYDALLSNLEDMSRFKRIICN